MTLLPLLTCLLLAADAQVELASTSGTRRVPVREFFVGPKKNAMRRDELISAFLVEPAPGPQHCGLPAKERCSLPWASLPALSNA